MSLFKKMSNMPYFQIRLVGNWDTQSGSADNLLKSLIFKKCFMCTKYIYCHTKPLKQSSVCRIKAQDG